MSIIKEIYIDDQIRKGFKTSSLSINGRVIRENSKFNIFNNRIIDLNQNSDFSIDYILEIFKDIQAKTSDPINGLQIKPPSKSTIKDTTETEEASTAKTSDPINGLQIKPPSKNKSSVIINGQLDTNVLGVKIDGIEVIDTSRIILFIDGILIKSSKIKIIFNIDKNNLLKLTRIKK